MTLTEFVKKYLGRKIDFDGYYGGQFVDLYRQYVKEVLEFPQSPGVGGAAEIWDTADPEYYDFINYEPTAIPQIGDIVIWNRKAGGGFGHVAVFVEGTVDWFNSFDQNWPTLNKCTITTHDYTNVIGWLRPKENMNEEQLKMLQERLGWYEKEYPLEQQRLVDKKVECEAFRGENNAISVQLEEADNKYQTFVRVVASVFGTTQKEDDIIAAARNAKRENDEYKAKEKEAVKPVPVENEPYIQEPVVEAVYRWLRGLYRDIKTWIKKKRG